VFLGYLLLSIASFLLLLDIYMLSKPSSSIRSFWNRLAAFVASVLCVLAAFFLYLNSFLSNDFSLRDVYAYSSADLPVMYKLYASWAGAGGSLLLWSAMLGTIYLVYRTWQRRSAELDQSRSYMYLSIFLIFMLAATILADPFARLGFDVGGGLGLNPLLQSPWMAIHPPVIFLGYALPFVPLALSLTNLSRRKENHEGSVRFFMQLSWLVFTLGIALGGVWAYEVLGWGGYWAWDPVETASLLPWLMITAYFHTAPMAGQDKSLIKEFSILAATLLVIFATLITRSGALASVHAFEASVSGTASPFILLLLYLAGYFIYLRGRVNRPIFRIPRVQSKDSISLMVAYVSLLYITAVCLLGVSLPALRSIQLGTTYSLGKEFYNTWLLPPTILFVIALIFCNAPKRLNIKACTVVTIIVVFGGVLLAIVRLPTPNQLADFGLPFLLVALVFTFYSLVYTLVNLGKVRRFSSVGRGLIHISLVLILLGVFLSSSMETSDQRSLRVGDTFSGMGVTLKVTNANLSGPFGSIYTQNGTLPEHSLLELDVAASSGGSDYSGRLWTGLYSVYGLASKPLIFREGLNDIYVTIGFTDSLYQALLLQLATNEQPQLSEFTIQLKVIPYVNLIWLGVALFTLGIMVSIIADIRRHRRES